MNDWAVIFGKRALARGAGSNGDGWGWGQVLVLMQLSNTCVQETNSGVTMGWLLRLVTGAPLVVGAPTVLFYVKSEGRGPDLKN